MMAEPLPLQELLHAEFEGEWRDDLATITRARSNQQISALVDRLVWEELEQKIHGAIFAEKSVGAVFGLELSSGDRVVLKLFHPTQSLVQLAAVHRCLNILVHSGFPAPPPQSRLFQTEDGITGAFYQFMDGTIRDAHEPVVRQELAQVLAELARILSDENFIGLPLAPTRGSELYPPSHRSFLQLHEASEARWIDDIARRAQSVVQAKSLPLIPAHLDWGVKNCRFHQDKVSVVYDWDSLFAASEAEMVGRAAVQFTAQWNFPAPLMPSLAELFAFVHEYQTARGRSFTDEERVVLAASANYMLAQEARLELACGDSSADGSLALLQSCERGVFLEMGDD